MSSRGRSGTDLLHPAPATRFISGTGSYAGDLTVTVYILFRARFLYRPSFDSRCWPAGRRLSPPQPRLGGAAGLLGGSAQTPSRSVRALKRALTGPRRPRRPYRPRRPRRPRQPSRPRRVVIYAIPE